MKIEELEMIFPAEGEVRLLVAHDDRGEMVGTLRVRHEDPFVAQFAGLFVLASHRGRGVATELIQRAETIAREDFCCVTISCGVQPSNLIARQVYAKLGFAIAYVFESGELLMSKPIQPLHVAHPKPIGGAS